jgi:hypothetical protein
MEVSGPSRVIRISLRSIQSGAGTELCYRIPRATTMKPALIERRRNHQAYFTPVRERMSFTSSSL